MGINAEEWCIARFKQADEREVAKVVPLRVPVGHALISLLDLGGTPHIRSHARYSKALRRLDLDLPTHMAHLAPLRDKEPWQESVPESDALHACVSRLLFIRVCATNSGNAHVGCNQTTDSSVLATGVITLRTARVW